MSRERLVWIAIALALLLTGMVLGQRVQAPVHDSQAASFRHWFWEGRSLDLIVQVGLIFAGALGISALLPRSGEDNSE